MSRTKSLLDDLELHLTPEEREERREVSELDAKREENMAQLRAFMPSRYYMHDEHETVSLDEERLSRTWKTRDGSLILISKMSDSHLLNAIKMMQRRYELIQDEAQTQAEMADLGTDMTMVIGHAFVEAPDSLLWLEEEAEHRGLKFDYDGGIEASSKKLRETGDQSFPM